MVAVLKGSACVVSAVRPQMHAKLARLALDAGAHFCDLGGGEIGVLGLASEAAERSRWVVPNCGFAPGLANILTMRGIEAFDEVDTVTVRAGNIPVAAEPPFYHRLAYSANRLIENYTAATPMLRDGEVVAVEPLTGVEEVLFEPPFPVLEAFYTAGKLSTLPYDLTGRVRTLDYKTLRHPGHAAAMRAVLALGFGEDHSLDVRTHLTYRDVLARRLGERLGGDYHDASLLRIRITGEAGGQLRTLTYELVERFDPETGLSALQRCTGYPTAAAAVLLGSGQVPGGGAAPLEQVVPREPFFEALTQRGLEIEGRWEEAGVEV